MILQFKFPAHPADWFHVIVKVQQSYCCRWRCAIDAKQDK